MQPRDQEPNQKAHSEAPFDPDARQVGSDDLTYVDFFDVLTEKPDPSDPCNAEIQRYRAQGRSEAFCREFRVGYDNAKTTLRSEEPTNSAQCRFRTAGLARATKLHGEYHEA